LIDQLVRYDAKFLDVIRIAEQTQLYLFLFGLVEPVEKIIS
jgi:hypothetical protein